MCMWIIANGRGKVGGGIFVCFYETPTSINASIPGEKLFPEALLISNCQFIGNHATVEGAGLYIGLHEPVAFSHPPGHAPIITSTHSNACYLN